MDKDFDKEKIFDSMRSLRDKRDLEILNQNLENVTVNISEEKQVKNDKVLNVKYLGKIEINGEEKEIYILTEQRENKDGKLTQIEKYYTGDGEFLGGNNKSDQYNYLILNEKYSENKKLQEKLQSLDKDGILDLNELEQERLEEIAKILGISPEELEKMAEIEADKEIDEKEQENTEEKEEMEERDEKKGILNKKEVEKISTKAEIETNQKVTDNKTMASMLGVEDKGYKKIAIIYSDKINENSNTTKFSFVGIKEDGSAEKIDSLEQTHGNDPTKKVNEINRDGSEIKQDQQVNSVYRIKGEKETRSVS